MMVSFCAVPFPLDVLDEILDLSQFLRVFLLLLEHRLHSVQVEIKTDIKTVKAVASRPPRPSYYRGNATKEDDATRYVVKILLTKVKNKHAD